jgi:hypothetical protein
MPDPLKNYLTPPQFAAHFARTRQLIYGAIKRGEIATTDCGGRIMIHRREVEKFAARNLKPGPRGKRSNP